LTGGFIVVQLLENFILHVFKQNVFLAAKSIFVCFTFLEFSLIDERMVNLQCAFQKGILLRLNDAI